MLGVGAVGTNSSNRGQVSCWESGNCHTSTLPLQLLANNAPPIAATGGESVKVRMRVCAVVLGQRK